jgi:hypothetical protein
LIRDRAGAVAEHRSGAMKSSDFFQISSRIADDEIAFSVRYARTSSKLAIMRSAQEWRRGPCDTASTTPATTRAMTPFPAEGAEAEDEQQHRHHTSAVRPGAM